MKNGIKSIVLILVFVLIALAICVLPMPVRIHAELSGAALTQDLTVLSDSAIVLDGWRYHYLLRKDTARVHVEVFHSPGAEDPIFHGTVEGLLLTPEDTIYAVQGLLLASDPGSYQACSLYFTAGGEHVLLTVPDRSVLYAASDDAALSPDQIFELFQAYIPPQ